MIKQIALHQHGASSSFTNPATNNIEGLNSTNLQPVFDRLETIDHKMDELLALVSGTTKSHYPVEEMAQLTSRSGYTVRRWIKEKLITATRIEGTGPRGRWLIPRSELEKLIRLGRGGTVPEAAFIPNGS
jgi:excisionase family DNA binding protein